MACKVIQSAAYNRRTPKILISLGLTIRLFADTLFVWLLDRYLSTDEFVSKGMASAVRDLRSTADVMLVDAHMGYSRNCTVL